MRLTVIILALAELFITAGCHDADLKSATRLPAPAYARAIAVATTQDRVAFVTNQHLIVADRDTGRVVIEKSAQHFDPVLEWLPQTENIVVSINGEITALDAARHGSILSSVKQYAYTSSCSSANSSVFACAGTDSVDFGQDGDAFLFSVTPGAMLRGTMLPQCTGASAWSVSAVALTNGDLRCAVSYDNECEVNVLDVVGVVDRTLVPRGTIALHEGGQLAFSEDGTYLACLQRGRCIVVKIDAGGASEIYSRTFDAESFDALPFSWHGARLLDMSPNGEAVAYSTGRQLILHRLGSNHVYTVQRTTSAVCFCSDKLLAAGHESEVVVYNVPEE